MPDTRDWTTHCFGRHLVTLPPDAVIARLTRLQGEAIVPLADSYTELMARIETDARPRNAAAGPQRIVLDDRSLGLLSPSSADAAGRRLQAYLVARPTWRVFDWRQSIAKGEKAEVPHEAGLLARHLRSREAAEVPEGIGYCIDGGFIAAELGSMQVETRVELSFPSHPGIQLSFLSGAHPAASPDPAGMRPLRRDRRNAGPLRGQEHLLASADKTRCGFAFTWRSQAAGQPPASLKLRCSSITDKADPAIETSRHPAALSDREILALWDAVVGSLHLRPVVSASPSPAPDAMLHSADIDGQAAMRRTRELSERKP